MGAEASVVVNQNPMKKLCLVLFNVLSCFCGYSQSSFLDTSLLWCGCSHDLPHSMVFWISPEDTLVSGAHFKKVYYSVSGDTVIAGGLRETSDSLIYGFISGDSTELLMYNYKIGPLDIYYCETGQTYQSWGHQMDDKTGKRRPWIHSWPTPFYWRRSGYTISTHISSVGGLGSNIGLFNTACWNCVDTPNWITERFPLSVGIKTVIDKTTLDTIWRWDCIILYGNNPVESITETFEYVNTAEVFQIKYDERMESYRLLNVMGNVTRSGIIDQEGLSINKASLPHGWYLCEIRTADKRILRLRFTR